VRRRRRQLFALGIALPRCSLILTLYMHQPHWVPRHAFRAWQDALPPGRVAMEGGGFVSPPSASTRVTVRWAAVAAGAHLHQLEGENSFEVAGLFAD